jgi:hypothetical protein
MFSGAIVWKGLVYAVLMMAAKLVCGIWFLRLTVQLPISAKSKQRLHALVPSVLKHICAGKPGKKGEKLSTGVQRRRANNAQSEPLRSSTAVTSEPATNEVPTPDNQQSAPSSIPKPRSIYPASIIGCAMVARGEIGFLISSIAEGNGMFTTGSDADAVSDMFLIVTWAVVLCTILGPLVVGILVQRVKKLHRGLEKQGQVVHRDVLGVWGISQVN